MLNLSFFVRKVEKAIEEVKQVLEREKNPILFTKELTHEFTDKYRMADFLTCSSFSGLINSLEACGLTETQLAKMVEWSKLKNVSIKFDSEEHCKFLRSVKRKLDETKKEFVVEGNLWNSKSRIETTVTDYIYELTVSYSITALAGSGESLEDKITLLSRSARYEITTSSATLPHPETTVLDAGAFGGLQQVNITPLLQRMRRSEDGGMAIPMVSEFQIDRTKDSCYTPRRNPDVEEVIRFFNGFVSWSVCVEKYFTSKLFTKQKGHSFNLAAINTKSLFVPVLPMIVEQSTEVVNTESRAGLNIGDANVLLEQQRRSLQSLHEKLEKVFPTGAEEQSNLISTTDAKLLVSLEHAREVMMQYQEALDYLEHMLMQQLTAAVGKEVTPKDFDEYMLFHNRKLFLPKYQPKPFCYAVRRSDEHAPEGVLSIERQGSGAEGATEPIYTLASNKTLSGGPMQFAINAATNVTFLGDRFIHGFLAHQFSRSGLKLTLRAEARQFSSYVVLVGRITSAVSFDPKHAFIVQNKDDFSIPLDLETIPSAKEFREAISSLSPEQQRFAKAFRSMQLESTLFGVCVIQIRPQLERVLQLPPDSLTKEIALTQQLMELFIEYQIPSDLLSFSGDPAASVTEKIAAVKSHVAALNDMIAEKKKQEIEESKQKAKFENPIESSEDESDNDDNDARNLFPSNKDQMEKFEDRSAILQVKSHSFNRGRGAARGVTNIFGSFKKKSKCASPPPMPMPKAVAPPAPPGGNSASKPKKLMKKDQSAMKRGHKESVQREETSIAEKEKIVEEIVTKEEGTKEDPNQPNDQPEDPTTQQDPQQGGGNSGGGVDVTKFPSLMDSRLESVDKDGAVRPTILNVGSQWKQQQQKALLGKKESLDLDGEKQRELRGRAFSLLDALSRAGGLPVTHASLHVVLAATHCFDRSVMEWVVQRNSNPIEKVECSALVMAGVVHGVTPEQVPQLVKPDQAERVLMYSPMLITFP